MVRDRITKTDFKYRVVFKFTDGYIMDFQAGGADLSSSIDRELKFCMINGGRTLYSLNIKAVK